MPIINERVNELAKTNLTGENEQGHNLLEWSGLISPTGVFGIHPDRAAETEVKE